MLFMNNPPDPSLLPVHSLRIRLRVLVARILVAPVHDPEKSVRASLCAHRTKPAVIGAEEIAARLAFEGGADGREDFLVDGIVMDVSDERMAPGVLRIAAALVDLHPGIRGAEMFMSHDAGEQFIRIRILRRA